MTLKQRVDQHDREIAAIRKLILAGMKMLNRTNERLDRLVTAQRETDRQLKSLRADVQALVSTLRRGTNGHTKRKLDLQ
jgi:septal ring factor EnvC (AmiA/AmiB activator)